MIWDLIVIGGGSAGLTAATIAGRVGASVLLIDKEALGGDCLHTGCVPSKALIRCARVAHQARHAARFGVDVGPVTIDFGRVMDHVAGSIAHIAVHDSPDALAAHGVEVAFGGAELLSDTRVRIGGTREEEAKRIILAVGSHAHPPPIEGLAQAGYLDHVGVFALRERPQRLVVIGGGAIGVELGQAFARFGSDVTLLELGDRLLPRDDAELAGRLAELLSREMTLRFGAKTTRVEARDGAKVVHFEVNGEAQQVVCDELLVAVGRRANTDGLNLKAAGIKTDRGRIVVDQYLRTSSHQVFAAGDCCGPFQFTHFAEAQARLAARNALFVGRSAFGRPNVPWVTFCQPELAHVGLTEAEARPLHPDLRVHHYAYERLDRAVCDGDTDGLAKVLTNTRGTILGASILGPGAGEAIAPVVVAMDAGRSLQALGGSIFAYPTLSRVVRRLADERFIEDGVSPFVARWLSRYDGR